MKKIKIFFLKKILMIIKQRKRFRKKLLSLSAIENEGKKRLYKR
jgi:hypothetical protein